MYKDNGFTLLELIITLAIAAILIATVIPGMQNLLQNNRVITQTNVFITALNSARSEAIKRNRRISLCNSSNGISCYSAAETPESDPSPSGGWEEGWIVFTDLGSGDSVTNDIGKRDGNDRVLNVFSALPDGYSLRGNNNFVNYLSYLPSGRSNNIGRFVVCSANETTYSRIIVISFTGRARLVYPEDYPATADSCVSAKSASLS